MSGRHGREKRLEQGDPGLHEPGPDRDDEQHHGELVALRKGGAATQVLVDQSALRGGAHEDRARDARRGRRRPGSAPRIGAAKSSTATPTTAAAIPPREIVRLMQSARTGSAAALSARTATLRCPAASASASGTPSAQNAARPFQ